MEKRDRIYFGLVLFLLILVLFLIYVMKSESAQCVKNPFVYGAKKGGQVDCSCVQFIGNCTARFIFNETSFVGIPTKCDRHTIYQRGFIFPVNYDFDKLLKGGQ